MDNQLDSYIHHGGVENTEVTFDRESTLIINTGILHWHPVSGYSHVVKSAPPIVFAMVAKLRANVTSLDTFHHLPSVRISNLDYERHDTIGVTFNY